MQALHSFQEEEENLEFVLARLRFKYKTQPWAKPPPATAAQSSGKASAEYQFQVLLASIAALREEMEFIDKEQVGEHMLAERSKKEAEEASAQSDWSDGQWPQRWESSSWWAWNASWQAQDWFHPIKHFWKGESKGKGFDSAPSKESWPWLTTTESQVGEADQGLGQVGEMDAATLLADMQKRQKTGGQYALPETVMKTLGETVKLQHQLFQLLAEGQAVPAEAQAAQASAQSAAAPQEPAAEAADEVPLNADGECEAVARLCERDLAGCLTCIRAGGRQVVMGWCGGEGV